MFLTLGIINVEGTKQNLKKKNNNNTNNNIIIIIIIIIMIIEIQIGLKNNLHAVNHSYIL